MTIGKDLTVFEQNIYKTIIIKQGLSMAIDCLKDKVRKWILKGLQISRKNQKL